MAKNKLWFRNKKYGWGWFPQTWQGWTVVFIFAAIIFIEASYARMIGPGLFGTIIAITVLILIIICRKKGEKPRWRWGK